MAEDDDRRPKIYLQTLEAAWQEGTICRHGGWSAKILNN